MELLVPAGNFDSLKAAVSNGADAVYIGAAEFSARAFAENFSNLRDPIEYAHQNDMRIYLALNTLIHDREIKHWLKIAGKAAHYGIDAFITQDLGGAMLLKQTFPQIPLHASTQMSAHKTDNAWALEELGFERVILARELSLSQIKKIRRNTNIELEIFVHGAMCYSYSGQCLLSSLIGARSANRGVCAQPCRLPYQLNGKKGDLLSLPDLCLADHIHEIRKAGVTSIKIEGRMKSAQYTAAVTRAYRKAVDTGQLSVSDKKELLCAFRRRLYTDLPFAAKIKDKLRDQKELKGNDPKQTIEIRIPYPLKPDIDKKPEKISVQVHNFAQAQAVIRDADILYAPFSIKNIDELSAQSKKYNTTLCYYETLGGKDSSHIKQNDKRPVLVKTLILPEHRVLIADYTFNVMNGATLEALKAVGYKAACLSPELNAAQMRDLPNVMQTEAIAYGYLPLMTSAHCPLGCKDKKCIINKKHAQLIDRRHKKFYLRRISENCTVEILNSSPLYMADKLELISADMIRLLFTIETPAQCREIMRSYKEALQGASLSAPTFEFTRGHYTRGV